MSNPNYDLKVIEWLKDLFDHAYDLIQIVNIDGSVIYVNRAWSELLEYDQGDIIGKSLYSFIYQVDRERYRLYRERVINQILHGQSIAIHLVTKSGKIVPVEGVVSVKIDEGKPRYTRGIFHNISKQIEQEKALKELNSQLLEREYNLQQLLTYAPDAIVVINAQSLITYWNPKAEEIFGWRTEEVLNRSLAETIIPEGYRNAHEAGMRRYLITGEKHVLNRTIEITALKKSQEEFFISLTISQTTQNGKTAFVAFIRDITQQKRAASEMENKNRQLEFSNKSLEAFAYAASHDLKQPARKIQIFTDRLRSTAEQKLNEVERNYLEKIDRSVLRMRNLVEDILTFSSLSEEVNFASDVNLNNILMEVLEDLEIEIQEKGSNIHAEALPIVQGNARQLHQLFFNLVSNAIKYSKPGGSNNVWISSSLVFGENSAFPLADIQKKQLFHQIEVRDDGIGFEQEHAQRIFQVFTRLHDQQQYQGTGVGLSIAQKVVQNHNGIIVARGEPGNGAIFIVLLPSSGL